MADHASTTTAPPVRRGPSDTALARVLTSATPGEILLGSDDTGGPVLRIPTTSSREDLEAAAAAQLDMLARMEPAEMLSARTLNVPQRHIIPTADQVRAAYRSNGDRLPANLRSGFVRAVIG